MVNKPNIPMNHAITTCRHKVDKEKFNDGWERIWGNSKNKDQKTEKDKGKTDGVLK